MELTSVQSFNSTREQLNGMMTVLKPQLNTDEFYRSTLPAEQRIIVNAHLKSLQLSLIVSAAIHLMTQKRRSMLIKSTDPKTHAVTTGMCAYRGEDGLMCAIGAFIDDSLYKEEFETKRVIDPDVFNAMIDSVPEFQEAFVHFRSLPRSIRLETEHDFASIALELQKIHDHTPNTDNQWLLKLSELFVSTGGSRNEFLHHTRAFQ